MEYLPNLISDDSWIYGSSEHLPEKEMYMANTFEVLDYFHHYTHRHAKKKKKITQTDNTTKKEKRKIPNITNNLKKKITNHLPKILTNNW